MLRYLRLWWRSATLSLMRQTEYRVSFVLRVLEGIAQLGLALLTFALIYRFTGEIDGWSLAQVTVLVGIYRIADGLVSMLLSPNLWAIAGYIRTGEMDGYLLRPLSSQFLVSLRLVNWAEAVNALVGLALIFYAAPAAGVQGTPAAVAEALLLGLCGIVLLYTLWFFIVTFSFWLVQIDNLASLFSSFFEAARYPVSFFKGGMRALLTFAIPVAFATTFPTQALLGTLDARYLIAGPMLAALALLGTHLFWNFAVRHYSSASS